MSGLVVLCMQHRPLSFLLFAFVYLLVDLRMCGWVVSWFELLSIKQGVKPFSVQAAASQVEAKTSPRGSRGVIGVPAPVEG